MIWWWWKSLEGLGKLDMKGIFKVQEAVRHLWSIFIWWYLCHEVAVYKVNIDHKGKRTSEWDRISPRESSSCGHSAFGITFPTFHFFPSHIIPVLCTDPRGLPSRRPCLNGFCTSRNWILWIYNNFWPLATDSIAWLTPYSSNLGPLPPRILARSLPSLCPPLYPPEATEGNRQVSEVGETVG